MDRISKSKRSENMRRVKSHDTDIELVLRKKLWERGIRYRKNYKKLPGKPDIVLTKYKIAVFCDSEFFHGYNWEIKKQKLDLLGVVPMMRMFTGLTVRDVQRCSCLQILQSGKH